MKAYYLKEEVLRSGKPYVSSHRKSAPQMVDFAQYYVSYLILSIFNIEDKEPVYFRYIKYLQKYEPYFYIGGTHRHLYIDYELGKQKGFYTNTDMKKELDMMLNKTYEIIGYTYQPSEASGTLIGPSLVYDISETNKFKAKQLQDIFNVL